MKKILHLTVFLALIAALAGGALAFANNMTAPVIAANELAAEKETLKEIYPDVSDDAFVKVKDNASKTIEKIFEVEGKGYIFKMKVTGYKDGTSYLVALNKDGSVYDYVAISNGDTQGLGSKVTEKPFRESLRERMQQVKRFWMIRLPEQRFPVSRLLKESVKQPNIRLRI